jgi:D-xylose transport system substrate-binding protein
MALLVSGCGNNANTNSPNSSDAPTIALFLPESKTTRYEAFDRRCSRRKLSPCAAPAKLLYANADQDAAKQQQQVEAAARPGRRRAGARRRRRQRRRLAGQQAKQKKIPVIAYDRLISAISYEYYVSFNNVRVGEMQGEALLDALKKAGPPTRARS